MANSDNTFDGQTIVVPGAYYDDTVSGSSVEGFVKPVPGSAVGQPQPIPVKIINQPPDVPSLFFTLPTNFSLWMFLGELNGTFMEQSQKFAKSLVLYTPQQTTPNTPITLFGTYVPYGQYSLLLYTPYQAVANTSTVLNAYFSGGLPVSIDISFTGIGGPWTTLPSNEVVINPTAQTIAITLQNGVPAATYPAGQVIIRDTNNPTVTASAGEWVVSPFNPATVSSGSLVFGFQAANPACVTLNSSGNVIQINDLNVGSGQYATLGPTAIPSPLSPTPLTVPVGSGVLGGNPVGPPAPYLRNSGNDSTRSLVQMAPTLIADNAWDPNANFFDFGQLGGPNDAIIKLFNINTGAGNHTIVFGCYINVSVASQFGVGLIWGRWINSTTSVAYLNPGRWHSGQWAAQLYDGTNFFSASQAVSTSRWAVCTMQWNGTTYQWRMNKGSWTTNTITPTAAFSATNCYWGGSVATGLNQPGGNALPDMGDFYIFRGVLNSTDLGNVESMVGQGIGVFI